MSRLYRPNQIIYGKTKLKGDLEKGCPSSLFPQRNVTPAKAVILAKAEILRSLECSKGEIRTENIPQKVFLNGFFWNVKTHGHASPSRIVTFS